MSTMCMCPTRKIYPICRLFISTNNLLKIGRMIIGSLKPNNYAVLRTTGWPGMERKQNSPFLINKGGENGVSSKLEELASQRD